MYDFYIGSIIVCMLINFIFQFAHDRRIRVKDAALNVGVAFIPVINIAVAVWMVLESVGSVVLVEKKPNSKDDFDE